MACARLPGLRAPFEFHRSARRLRRPSISAGSVAQKKERASARGAACWRCRCSPAFSVRADRATVSPVGDLAGDRHGRPARGPSLLRACGRCPLACKHSPARSLTGSGGLVCADAETASTSSANASVASRRTLRRPASSAPPPSPAHWSTGQWPQLQVVGVGELGLPGRAALAIEIDEQHAGVGLVAQCAGRIVLAVEDAGAQQGDELVLVEALDAIERDRRARIARAEHAFLAAGQ